MKFKEKIINGLSVLMTILVFSIPFLNSFENQKAIVPLSSIFLGMLMAIMVMADFWKIIRIKKIFKYYIFFVLINLIFLPYSINIGNSIKFLYQIIGFVSVFLVAAFIVLKVKDEHIFIVIKWVMIISIVIISIKGLKQFFFEFDFLLKNLENLNIPPDQIEAYRVRLQDKRIFSFFLYPNVYAGFLILNIPILTGFIIQDMKNKKYFTSVMLAITLLLAVINLGLTRSIGGILAIAAAAVISILIFKNQFKKIINFKYILWAGSLILMIITLIVIFRWDDLGEIMGASNPITMRYYNWKGAIDIFKDYPLTGIGLKNFGDIYPKYLIKGETQFVHNSYLQIMVESGIIGFLMIIIFVGKYVFHMIKHIRSSNKYEQEIIQIFMLMGILTFFIHNIADFTYYTYSVSIIFHFFLGILIFLPRQSRIYLQV